MSHITAFKVINELHSIFVAKQTQNDHISKSLLTCFYLMIEIKSY